ncbi:hypothetical protein DFH06DRAFT_1146126 [Mycena polygramma]|nr:hypothetical protein DFH06DRAFT_1146126 [Mycena polygramma]
MLREVDATRENHIRSLATSSAHIVFDRLRYQSDSVTCHSKSRPSHVRIKPNLSHLPFCNSGPSFGTSVQEEGTQINFDSDLPNTAVFCNHFRDKLSGLFKKTSNQIPNYGEVRQLKGGGRTDKAEGKRKAIAEDRPDRGGAKKAEGKEKGVGGEGEEEDDEEEPEKLRALCKRFNSLISYTSEVPINIIEFYQNLDSVQPTLQQIVENKINALQSNILKLFFRQNRTVSVGEEVDLFEENQKLLDVEDRLVANHTASQDACGPVSVIAFGIDWSALDGTKPKTAFYHRLCQGLPDNISIFEKLSAREAKKEMKKHHEEYCQWYRSNLEDQIWTPILMDLFWSVAAMGRKTRTPQFKALIELLVQEMPVDLLEEEDVAVTFVFRSWLNPFFNLQYKTIVMFEIIHPKLMLSQMTFEIFDEFFSSSEDSSGDEYKPHPSWCPRSKPTTSKASCSTKTSEANTKSDSSALTDLEDEEETKTRRGPRVSSMMQRNIHKREPFVHGSTTALQIEKGHSTDIEEAQVQCCKHSLVVVGGIRGGVGRGVIEQVHLHAESDDISLRCSLQENDYGDGRVDAFRIRRLWSPHAPRGGMQRPVARTRFASGGYGDPTHLERGCRTSPRGASILYLEIIRPVTAWKKKFWGVWHIEQSRDSNYKAFSLGGALVAPGSRATSLDPAKNMDGMAAGLVELPPLGTGHNNFPTFIELLRQAPHLASYIIRNRNVIILKFYPCQIEDCVVEFLSLLCRLESLGPFSMWAKDLDSYPSFTGSPEVEVEVQNSQPLPLPLKPLPLERYNLYLSGGIRGIQSPKGYTESPTKAYQPVPLCTSVPPEVDRGLAKVTLHNTLVSSITTNADHEPARRFLIHIFIFVALAFTNPHNIGATDENIGATNEEDSGTGPAYEEYN